MRHKGGVEVRRQALLIATVCGLLLLPLASPAFSWEVPFGHGETGGDGCRIGAGDSLTGDIYVPMTVYPEEVGVFTMEYMRNGADFPGATGLYSAAYTPPIAPGGSRTWSDIYLWAQNYNPNTANRIPLIVGTGDDLDRPTGYVGHLVLDYVPTACSWNGPMDFWLDLGANYTLTMPIITTSDPLQGTRFHFTVYAPPVPEPCSFAALALGAVPLAGLLRRRRR
jgi:hypothetical protein